MSDPYKAPTVPVYPEPLLKRPPIVWNPLTWLVLISLMMAFEAAWFGYMGEDTPQHSGWLRQFVFGALLAWWVYADRRARRMGMPWEFEALVLFLWPIVFPYYLYRTRGWIGLLLGAGFWLLFLVPTFVSILIHVALTG